MYGRLGASLAASLVVMYFLAFSQIDVFDHFKWSLIVFWITLSMVIPRFRDLCDGIIRAQRQEIA